MDTAVLSAVIALIGVVISVYVSYRFNKKALEQEIIKLSTEIEQDFSNKLLEKRLDAYPEIGFVMSDFIKQVYDGRLSVKSLIAFRHKMDELNSKYTLLFSNKTTSRFFKFRVHHLYPLVDETKTISSDDELKSMLSGERKQTFKKAIGEIEVSLKDEIGVNIEEYREIRRRTKIVDWDAMMRKKKLEWNE